MKVTIGKYRTWLGPYQLVNKLFFFLSDEKQDKIVDWMPKKPFDLLNKLQGERKIKVRIDDYDVWNMDTTLAHIIVPMLKKIKEDKHGAPYVDDEDVPDELKSTAALPKENDYDTDSNHFKRWDWVVDEMLWAFEQKLEDWEEQFYSGEPDIVWKDVGNGLKERESGPKDTFKIDAEGMKKHQERITNGYRLFGKYYDCLWT